MFCLSKPSKETLNSRDIDQYIQEDAKEKRGVINLLLLGTGESGKTTIIKQMKILHQNGFTKAERLEKIPKIKQNIHESIYDIIYHMDKIDPPINLKNEISKESAAYILNLGPHEPSEYSNEYFDNVKILWDDPDIKETFNRSNEFQLIDSAGYFLERIEEISQADYEPNDQDMLFCRIKTVAISKIEFIIPISKIYGGGNAKFIMYDVGGQRGERRKWLTVFEGIQAILFLISASDFDQTLREDNTKNRLKEALDVFEDICTNRFLRDTSLIVFLNKQDLLQKKIGQGRQVGSYFPEYENFKLSDKGRTFADEYERAKNFMKQQVEDLASIPVTVERITIDNRLVTCTLPPRNIYVHFTTATDTNNVKRVFDSVHDTILQKNVGTIFSL